MSRFTDIDPKLRTLSDKLQAKLSINREWMPTADFEERRIDWMDNEINKAIIIQPTFEVSGVNNSIWSFTNVAWIKIKGRAHKPGWSKDLIYKQDFNVIATNIDQLLLESVMNLKGIRIEDVIKNKST